MQGLIDWARKDLRSFYWYIAWSSLGFAAFGVVLVVVFSEGLTLWFQIALPLALGFLGWFVSWATTYGSRQMLREEIERTKNLQEYYRRRFDALERMNQSLREGFQR